MRAHYDFGKMKGERNPYVKDLKQPITMRLDKATVAYFKALATELGMPYQNLINLYLRDCALHHKRLQLKWASQEGRTAACMTRGVATDSTACFEQSGTRAPALTVVHPAPAIAPQPHRPKRER